jgi:MFS family permease
MIYPYLSIYIIALGAQKSELGLITSIGMLIAGLLGPITGRLIDWHGPKKIYIAGISMLIIAYATYALAPSWQICAVAMIIYFLGQGTGIHSCSTICGNCLENCDRAKGMMICESIAAGLLGMAGPMLAAFILVRLMGVTGSPSNPADIRPLFIAPLVTAFISLVIVVALLSNKRTASKSNFGSHILKDGLEILKGNRVAKKWIAISAITYMPAGMVLPFVQVFAEESKGASVVMLGTMVMAAAITSILFGFPIGALADKIGRKKVLYITMPLFCLSNIILIVAPSPAFLVIAGILQGFYSIGSPISASIERELVSAEKMGRWIGLNRMTKAVVGAIMAVISGVIYDKFGAQYIFLIYVGIELFVQIPLLMSIPETLKKKEIPGDVS